MPKCSSRQTQSKKGCVPSFGKVSLSLSLSTRHLRFGFGIDFFFFFLSLSRHSARDVERRAKAVVEPPSVASSGFWRFPFVDRLLSSLLILTPFDKKKRYRGFSCASIGATITSHAPP